VPPESPLARLVRAAALGLDAPMALAIMVGEGQAQVSASHGLTAEAEAWVGAWCLRTLSRAEPALEVRQQGELGDLPAWAIGAPVSAYASIPLALPGEPPDGLLCVLDARDRPFEAAQLELLTHLAGGVAALAAAALVPGAAEGLEAGRRSREAGAAVLGLRTSRLQVLRSLALSSDSGQAAEEQVKQALLLLAATFPELRVVWSEFEPDGLRVRFATGPPASSALTGLKKRYDSQGYVEALRQGQAIANRDIFEQPLLATAAAFLAGIGARATLDVLIVGTDTAGGMLSFNAATPFDWTPEHVEVLTETARQAGLLLRREEEARRRAGAEEALHKANALLTTVLAVQQAGTLLEDEQRRVVLASPQLVELWRLSTTPAALVGEDASALLGSLGPPAFSRRLQGLVEAGQPVSGEPLRLEDGRVFELDFVPVVMDGRLVGRLWQYRDVSARAQQTEALEAARNAALQAARAKAEFLATMSHEIRTPMNGVLGMLSLVLDSELTPDQRELAATAHDSGESLLQLLNDILDVSRMEAGRLALEEAPFDPAAAGRTVVALFGPSAREKGLQLLLELPGPLPRLLGDALRVQQVLTNLVSNAVKFTARGEVRVRLEWAAGVLRGEVQDSGPGVPPEKRGRLFEKFAQGDASTTRRHGGSGLGLSICKQLVDLMGGQLELVPALTGARFAFALPLAAAPEAPPARGALEGRQRFDGLQVLVVDDNAVNRRIATAHLEFLGCSVRQATNGKEALAQVSAGRPAVVFMDCYMPEMDGFDATRALRAGERGPRLPIIAMTASMLEEDRQRSTEAGMDDNLAKPTRRQDFIDRLRRWAP
jgi:signal transduction histidine kinase